MGVVGREEIAFVTLVGEGLDEPDTAERLLEPHVELPETCEDRPPRGGHPRAVMRDDPDRHRHDQNGQEREGRVDPEHEAEGAREGHHRDEEILRPVVRDLADLFQIAGDARDELAGPGAVVPAPGEAREVIEGAGAHLGLYIDAEHVAPVGHDRHQSGVQDVDHQQPGGGGERQAPVSLRQQPVDEEGDGQRKGKFEQAREHGAAKVQPEQALPRTIVLEELAKHHSGPR